MPMISTQDRGWGPSEEPRVLQIPGDHTYVQRIHPFARTGPSPAQIPSPAWSPDWLRAHRDEIDVVHVHFGFEHLDVDQLTAWVSELSVLAIPFVYTVHDLRNPHQERPEAHEAHLDVLIPAAAAVLTLTTGAADAIRRRWGRTAHVVAHPCVFDPDDVAAWVPTDPARVTTDPARVDRTAATGRTVGIHLKDLRRNVVAPDRVVEAACAGAESAGARLRIDVHPGTVDRPELTVTRALARTGRLDLHVHQRFDDVALARYLAGIDVYVLPHRFGTHSGWLEACRDVGTRVVAPSCGYYRDQWGEVVGYVNDESAGLDPASLTAAVRRALALPSVPRVDAGFRHRQSRTARDVHARIYRQVVAGVGAEQVPA